ncbi:MAG: cytochrome c biogenesis protein CcdA [Minisyncoccia bacterium]
MNRKILGLIFILAAFIALVGATKFSGGFEQSLLVSAKSGEFITPLVIFTAAVDSLNPCAFSVLFITIAFLLSLGKTRGDILKAGGSYIFGIFVTYFLIGLGMLQALEIFGMPNFMGKVGALILVLWGIIVVINETFPSFPVKLKLPDTIHPTIAKLIEKASIPAAFGLGVIVGLFEFPCVGGPYLMILGMLHDSSTHLAGIIYLIGYNLVFVLPLVLVLLATGNQAVLGKIQAWRKENGKQFHLWSGVIIIILGAIIFLV